MPLTQETPPAAPDIPSHPQSRFKPAYVIAGVGTLLVLVAVVWALSIYLRPDSTPKWSGPVENIRVGNVGEYTLFNLIAKEQGYFDEQGINATITEYTSGPASLEGLLTAKEDFAVAADFVGVRNIFSHPELRILAAANTHRVFQLVTRTENIKTLSDLKGKRIGITKNSAGEYFFGNFLAFNNIKLSDVTLVNQTPVEMLQAIEDGTIDGIVVFEPHIYKIKEKLGDSIELWDVQRNQVINALIYSTDSYLASHPGLAERYIKALTRAEQYYNQHMSEARAFVGQKLSLDPAYQEYAKPLFVHSIGLSHELLINMESEAKWVIDNKLTDQTEVPNFLNYFDFKILETIKPESITVIR